MIELASSDNHLLRLNQDMGYLNNEALISISYSAMKGRLDNILLNEFSCFHKLGIIAAGTNRGNIAFWVYTPNRRTPDIERHWNLQRAKTVSAGSPIRSLKVKTVIYPSQIFLISLFL
jgi:hypothetical protein